MVALQEPATRAQTSNKPERSAFLRWSIVVLAGFPPLAQIAFLLVKSRDTWTYLFADDAYYYLGVARNIGAGNGSTFSGLTETNGYHPLWELVLSVVAWAVRDPYLFVASVVVLQCLLWLMLVREAIAIGRAVGSEAAAVAGTALLGTLAVITGQLSFSGMESAPLLVLFLVAIRMLITLPDADSRAEVRVGIVFALVILTRLDAALTVAPLAFYVAVRPGLPVVAMVRRATRLLVPSAVSLAVYLSTNLVLFGTPTPVSGRAKSLGAPFANFTPVEQFFKAGQTGERPLWLGTVALLLCGVAFVAGDWRTSTARRRLMGVTGCLLAGQLLLLTYLVLATSYRVWAWYFYGIALTLLCAGTLVGLAAIRWMGAQGRRICLAVGVGFSVAQIAAVFFSGLSHGPEATETVEFLAEEIPEDAVIAMGDRAGLVGYLAEQPMLQLEGLMADEEWLQDLEEGTGIDRMIEEGVTYYIWSGTLGTEMTTRDGVPCRVLTEPRAGDGPKFDVTVCAGDRVFSTGVGAERFTVYRFRPEFNR